MPAASLTSPLTETHCLSWHGQPVAGMGAVQVCLVLVLEKYEVYRQNNAKLVSISAAVGQGTNGMIGT